MNGKVFYIIGKSSSGKDTIYKRLLRETSLKPIVPYTTRPMREGEMEGVNYFFVSSVEEMKSRGKIIESRSYNTKLGVWTYATVDDGQIDLSTNSYLTIGTISSYCKVKGYLKDVLPILEAQEDYTNDPLFASLSAFVKEKGYKNGYVMWPVRTAVSGKQNTPGGATEIMEVLGKAESVERIKNAIGLLSR